MPQRALTCQSWVCRGHGWPRMDCRAGGLAGAPHGLEDPAAMTRATVEILHFSDVLCVWAYVAQQRMDELRATFADKITITSHFVPVFGDVRTKLARGWAERGGWAGYAEHVREIGSRFGLDRIAPRTWAELVPSSSLSCHLFLRAVGAAERDGECRAGAMDELARAMRGAFFEQGRDIGRRPIQRELAEAQGLSLAAIERRIDDGDAYAAFSRDLDLVREYAVNLSPTLIFNEGRQRLNGNVGYRVIEANVRELLSGPSVGASWC
jgi:predicted DsbA family dithiol-disulfide isomerase